jgi:glycosyltransferase involved in cell wall biosynthesis
MLVSIIVPIYNTEKYISACLESIVNQTYKEIEIILVDDGSTDGSFGICADYAKKDPRIVIIQGGHQGVVHARKMGVERARGEYCMFVDSDDWIAENLLELIVPETDNGSTDIVNYNMRSVNGKKITDWHYTIQEGVYEHQQLDRIYEKMMFDFKRGAPGIIQAIYTKLIKKSVLKACIEAVDERITMGEDAAITYPAMLTARKIVITYHYLYFYRARPGSICHSRDVEIFAKIHIFQQYMQKVFSNYSSKYKLDKQLQAYLTLFINKGLSDVLSLRAQPLYHLPFYLPDMGKRIVLYGAGNVGRSYYKQLAQNEHVTIIAWIDRGLSGQRIFECEIKSPEILSSIEFDRILIAVKNKKSAEEIERQLCYQVLQNKIFWEEPKVNWWEREIEI